MIRSLLMLTILWFCATAEAQENRPPRLRWSPEPTNSNPPVRFSSATKMVTFSNGAKIELTQHQAVDVSDNGQVAAIYDRGTNLVRIYDSKGTEKSTFKTDNSYSTIVVSNSGLVAVYGQITLGMPFYRDFRLYGDGEILYEIKDGLFMNEGIQFSPNGEILVISGIKKADGESGQSILILIDRKGAILSQVLDEVAVPRGIHFGPRRHIALISQEHKGEETEYTINIYDAELKRWQKIIPDSKTIPYLNGSLVAFSENEGAIFVIGYNTVQAYELNKGNQLWSQQIPQLVGQTSAHGSFFLSSVGRILAAAHWNATDQQAFNSKFAVSFLTTSGHLIETHTTASYRLDPKQTHLWYLSPDGKSLLLNFDSGEKINVPNVENS